MLLRQLCKNGLPCCRRLRRLRLHRHHRRRCCFCCCCCVAAELLLCCCCCHIRVRLLRVPKKICCASRCQPIFPFSDTSTRFVFFGDLMEFRRFVHRKHSESDAGMNLAFFTVDGIIGRIICIANTLGPCCQWPVYAYYRLVQATSQTPQTGQPPIFAMTITTMSNTAVKEGDILVTRSHICSGPRTGACC